MRTLNDIKIGPVETLTEEELKRILDKLIEFAKSNPQSPEREYFDFKRELNLTTEDGKFKIRKAFSAFANTHGGWIIVGIAEVRDRGRVVGYEVVGVQDPSQYDKLRDILSADEYIRPRIEFQSKMITYKGKPVLIFYIPEHSFLVEVRKTKDDIWIAYRRYGNRTDVMSEGEKIEKFFQGATTLPKELRTNVSELKFYSVNDSQVEPYITCTVNNIERIYRWVGIGLYPIILIPTLSIPLKGHSRVYRASSLWQGGDKEYEKFLQILRDIENALEEFPGINFEVWSLWTPSSRLNYFVGCNACGLIKCIEGVLKRSHYMMFVWILYSTVMTFVIGRISEGSCTIEVRSLSNFIPNKYPFIRIDDIGRVSHLPLPVRETEWWNKDFVRKWNLPLKEELWYEDIPDKLLEPLPSARIIGYLGEKPRSGVHALPRVRRGFTLVDIKEPNKLPKEAPPIIADFMPLFTLIRSAPGGLNDLKEVKIIGLDLEALIMPEFLIHDMIVVLFSLECHVNQLKAYRITDNQ